MTPSVTPPSTNGSHDRDELFGMLTAGPLTLGYRPSIPYQAYGSGEWLPQYYVLRDVETMRTHPMVSNAMEYYKGGIAGAEFEGPDNPADPEAPPLPVSDDPQVSAFVVEQCKRFWDRGVPGIQEGYDYGWIGCENLYEEEDALLKWTHLEQFSPRDTFLLTVDNEPVGVRVKGIRPATTGAGGSVDLFLGSTDVPAKALWYAHRPRYGGFYGRSQYTSAWRPWRRLATKDAAETVLDTAFYRWGYAGPMLRYPEEDLQSAQALPATVQDSQGRPRRYARDVARQMAEWMKAGAAIGLPSSKYPQEMGGGYKWEVEWPDHAFNGDPILNYIKYLLDQISYGIGVPPELLQSAETGSGYSGRSIPMESFLAQQQQVADAILWLFVRQVLRPLVRWNFGPEAKFDVKVRSLLKSKRAMMGNEEDKGKGTQPPPENIMPGTPGQQAQPPGAAPPVTPPEVAAPFSLGGEAEDRIRRIARSILQRGAA